MGRCYACYQENCGYRKCDCRCHVEDDKPAVPAPAAIGAKSELLGTPCPCCSSINTRLLFIGDPPSKRKKEEIKSMGATVVVETGATLGACSDCRQTWFLDNQS